MTWEIDTAAKRARLPVRKNPYWRGIAGGRGGVSLGYRRRMNGPGAWIAKMIVDGNRFEERIGVEDDPSAPANAVGYRTAVSQALDWSLRQHSALEATGSVESTQRPTVRGAFKSYAKYRISRSERDGKNAEGRLAKHVLSDKAFSDMRLSKLQSTTIDDWRNRLPVRTPGAPVPREEDKDESLTPSSINRLLNDLRAALNKAGLKHRRELVGRGLSTG